jgi:hypothetical protein
MSDRWETTAYATPRGPNLMVITSLASSNLAAVTGPRRP